MSRSINHYTAKDLTFVVCAYKNCKYLEEAVESLINQTKTANIIITTSTPNKYITNIANKYNIQLSINNIRGQVSDYNHAVDLVNTKFVMLMHQDEVLMPNYVEAVIEALNFSNDPSLAFTNYREMHNDMLDDKDSSLVKIKRILLFPCRWRFVMSKKFGKRLILRFGDPITHPTVVMAKDKLPSPVFREEYKASMDWDLWERLSLIKGSFVYVNKVLLYHRMNEDNQTVKLLNSSNARYDDQYDIFLRFWPKPIAKVLMFFYKRSEKYY